MCQTDVGSLNRSKCTLGRSSTQRNSCSECAGRIRARCRRFGICIPYFGYKSTTRMSLRPCSPSRVYTLYKPPQQQTLGFLWEWEVLEFRPVLSNLYSCELLTLLKTRGSLLLLRNLLPGLLLVWASCKKLCQVNPRYYSNSYKLANKSNRLSWAIKLVTTSVWW